MKLAREGSVDGSVRSESNIRQHDSRTGAGMVWEQKKMAAEVREADYCESSSPVS